MSRILLVGEPPPFLMGATKIEAANYRTAQLLEPLLGDGHEILLVTPRKADHRLDAITDWPNLTHLPMDFSQSGWISALRQAARQHQPDCIVAVDFNCCVYASRLFGLAPIWMDIYGDPLTIMQAATYRQQSDRGLKTFAGFVRRVLKAGDIFSVCSTPQLHMLTGELAMSGRLNKDTFGYEFGRVILPGARVGVGHDQSPIDAGRELMRSIGLADDAFIVLWAGGYNTWTDTDTLFGGLNSAMQQDPRIAYVSVGAGANDASATIYECFRRQVGESAHRNRFHLLGWRPWTEMDTFYRESDLGINIDARHYETTYGTRTRLVEMIGAGLPVVTSTGTEISQLLIDSGCAVGFAPGDAAQLGHHLARLAVSPMLLQQLTAQSGELARTHLAWDVTTQPVRDWVVAPSYAPDHATETARQRVQALEYELRARVRWALWKLRGAYR